MQKRTLTSSAFALLVAAIFAISVPAFAQGGSDDTATANSATTTSSTTESDTSGGTSSETTTSTTETPRQKLEDARKKAREDHKVTAADKAEVKNDQQARKLEHRLKVCEDHQHGLETKFNHIVTNSQRMQDRIDGILTKAEAYQKDNNVNAADFVTLDAAAQTAKTASADAIAQMQAGKPSVDCTKDGSAAAAVAQFKTLAANTRDKLKAYRTAVKAVLKSLIDAKATTSTTTNTGGNQ